jgi:hypothetical protein
MNSSLASPEPIRVVITESRMEKPVPKRLVMKATDMP